MEGASQLVVQPEEYGSIGCPPGTRFASGEFPVQLDYVHCFQTSYNFDLVLSKTCSAGPGITSFRP